MAAARADIEAVKKQVADQHRRLLAQSAEVFKQAAERKKKLLKINADDMSPSCKMHLKLLNRLRVQFSPKRRQHRDATQTSSALNQMRVMEAGQTAASALDKLCGDAKSLFDAHGDREYVIGLKARLVEAIESDVIIHHNDVPEAIMSATILRVNSAQLFVIANYLLTDKQRDSRKRLQTMVGTRKVVEALRFSQTRFMDEHVAGKALDEYESRIEKYWTEGGSPPSWNYVVSLAHAQVQDTKVTSGDFYLFSV